MNFNKKLATAVSGAVLLMAGQFALADSTADIVDALVSKGVLTEEEGKLISKGHAGEKKAQDKSIKGKLSISNALENATLYGDMRARYEYRDGTALGVISELNRARLKATLGVAFNDPSKDKWYGDFAFATGSTGRSDNFNMGTITATDATKADVNTKAGINLKRMSFGWNPTEWFNAEVGRQKIPLYTTPMVWDADLTPDALVERLKFKTAGGTEFFVTGMQNEYYGTRLATQTQGGSPIAGAAYLTTGGGTTELIATQAGFKTGLTDTSSLKAAVTHTFYTRKLGTATYGSGAGSTGGTFNHSEVNDLTTIEVPAELNYFMSSSNIGLRLYGDYVVNLDADDRANNSNLVTAGAGAGNEDYAWLLGIKVASASDLKAFEGNKGKAGDWQATIWWQETGLFALDNNLVDSDIFDSRLNMKGAILKAQYNIEDNVYFNLTYGHGERKNRNLLAVGAGDMGADSRFGNFDLAQFDLTYKF